MKEVPVKICSCNFGDRGAINEPGAPQLAFDVCPNINKLDNHIDCPSFQAVCHENEPCEPYWRLIRGRFKPIRHWCLMGEIKGLDYFIRPHLDIRTRFDEEVRIHFYLEEDQTRPSFSFTDAVIGHTILIMYAEKHDFLDGTTGVRQEVGDSVVIFKCSMQTLIKTFGSMMASPICFECGAKPSSPGQNSSLDQEENPVPVNIPSREDHDSKSTLASQSLKKCSGCRIALYCNTVCQTRHWKDSHKNLCSSMKYLQLLHGLDFKKMSQKSVKECPAFSFSV